MSEKYSLNKEDFIKLVQVMAWSLSATIVTVLIAFIQEVQVPAQYAFTIPVINSLLYGIKLFIQERGV